MEDQNPEVVEDQTNEVEDQPEVQDEPLQDDTAEEQQEPEDNEEVVEEEPQQAPAMSRRKAERLEKLQSLVQKLSPQQPAQAPAPQRSTGMDYRQALDADPEVIAQLEADRDNAVRSAMDPVMQQVQTIQWNTRLEIDAPKVESKYPVLDKDASDFNPAVADAINQWYLNTVGFNSQTGMVTNPNVRYSDFVEGIMELADNMAGEKVVQSSKNIAKQVASTGLRPDGSQSKRLNLNQAPETMSDEELDAVIAQAVPRDGQGRFTKK